MHGMAFVTFTNNRDATDALNHFMDNSIVIDGRPLTCTKALGDKRDCVLVPSVIA